MQPPSDDAAVQYVSNRIESQKKAFRRQPFPSADDRRSNLGALAQMMIGHRARIVEALNADFGTHPQLGGEFIEVLGVAGRAAFAAENLEAWMKPQACAIDPNLYGSGRAYTLLQPKGVIGNMVPWNFPYDLSVGPLVEMLAAGNRAIIKPSELTPSCGELLREMIHATFDPDLVDVVIGEQALSQAFAGMAWDHLLFTGSPRVGRIVAQAAAANLVPTTLELGGKCPALFARGGINARAVAHTLGIKLVKDGQMCISVDYCLVPRGEVETFVELARAHAHAHLQGYAGSPNCTGIINARHRQRLEGLLEEARAQGARTIALDDSAGPRSLPLTLVIDPGAELALMREEIFGPILPIVPYDTLDEAIDKINAGERPLAVYAFTDDAAIATRVQHETVSGGFCHNAAAVHGSIAALGFGGVGHSGNGGRHHGVAGFQEFSNRKGVFVRGENDLIDALTPPYGEMAAQIVAAALTG